MNITSNAWSYQHTAEGHIFKPVVFENFSDLARKQQAAPALLDALVELLAMCERQEDFNDDGDGQMFDRARAAIAKATGAA